MRILITGGAGFLGARLAREILKKGQLNGQTVSEVVIADLFPAPADLLADPRVKGHAGPMLEQGDLFKSGFDGVFHLASAVSGECELDFDLGLRSNVDSSRLLLDSIRASGKASRLVFASSVAVFGPDIGNPMPDLVTDTTLPTPQTSYGTHKLMIEHMVADYTRKGYIDGRSARLMTVAVRPGKPNGAASSFFSGIIREPLSGVDAVCPVDASVSHPLSSPGNTIHGLITVFEASREAVGGRMALNLPGLNVTVGQMLDALEKVAGPAVRARVKFERDERVAGIVANWSRGSTSERANALGLKAESNFEAIIEQYIEDCKTRPGYPAEALNGLK
ncbi:D-erythronate dehydrogenase [Limnohabitans radicicola]|uniref:NAD-dependent epimerase/dehydratase family protein n=1 Tax=Limnohabitans radicicola TaxID=2771427 RepID=A0A927FDK1_9BURK|nr:D-erythronate dehydrogenase [Limnohabitans radicicola]MBD8049126.1 NAD-dependent epimerase/dehydratase family protein [Limnohabitans radicicola]